MLSYLLRRLAWFVPSLLAIYTLTFLLMRATPGSPWDETEKPLPAAVVHNLRAWYGLDRPLWEQYLSYLANALRGDLGPSYRSSERSVSQIIGETLPVSLQLGVAAALVALLIALPLGTLAALKHGSWLDTVISALAIVALATPPFVRVALLIVLLALVWRLVPTGGWAGLLDTRVIIPVIALALGPGAQLSRYVRSGLLEVLRDDYIRTARAKGLAEWCILYHHALRNALIPIVTVGGVTLVNLIIGAFFVETIYDIPGIGRQFINAVAGRDYPLILGTTLLFATLIGLVNLAVDIVYALLDPRIRYG